MLNFLKSQIKLFSESDIIKLALSEFYAKRRRQSREEWSANLPTIRFSPEEEAMIDEAEERRARGEFVEIDMDDKEQTKKFFGI